MNSDRRIPTASPRLSLSCPAKPNQAPKMSALELSLFPSVLVDYATVGASCDASQCWPRSMGVEAPAPRVDYSKNRRHDVIWSCQVGGQEGGCGNIASTLLPQSSEDTDAADIVTIVSGDL